MPLYKCTSTLYIYVDHLCKASVEKKIKHNHGKLQLMTVWYEFDTATLFIHIYFTFVSFTLNKTESITLLFAHLTASAFCLYIYLLRAVFLAVALFCKPGVKASRLLFLCHNSYRPPAAIKSPSRQPERGDNKVNTF